MKAVAMAVLHTLWIAPLAGTMLMVAAAICRHYGQEGAYEFLRVLSIMGLSTPIGALVALFAGMLDEARRNG